MAIDPQVLKRQRRDARGTDLKHALNQLERSGSRYAREVAKKERARLTAEPSGTPQQAASRNAPTR